MAQMTALLYPLQPIIHHGIWFYLFYILPIHFRNLDILNARAFAMYYYTFLGRSHHQHCCKVLYYRVRSKQNKIDILNRTSTTVTTAVSVCTYSKDFIKSYNPAKYAFISYTAAFLLLLQSLSNIKTDIYIGSDDNKITEFHWLNVSTSNLH